MDMPAMKASGGAATPGGTGVFLQNRDFFGAMVVHVPLLDALRQADPRAPLVVYTPFERGRMYASIGLADDVVVYRAAGGSLWSDLRERRFERIVTLRPQSFGLTALISTAGAGRTLGYATALSRLVLTRTIRRDVTIYRALNYVNLLAGEVSVPAFGEAIRRLAARSSRAIEPSTGRSSADRPSDDTALPYVLMPCGSEERKLWGEANFVALARAIADADRDARFHLVLGGGEARYVDLFARAGLADRTQALVDGSLPDIAQVVLRARAVVANDCGPSHVAQLSGVPLVLVFGNWDGAARVRIDEWFWPRPGARCLTTRDAGPVAALAVGEVLAALHTVRDDPATPPAVLDVVADPVAAVRAHKPS
jgi:ADP-heptose:LPS heptosyltransferase